MRRTFMDTALMTLLGLLVATDLVISAAGGEKAAVVFLTIILSVAVLIVGFLLVGHRRSTQRRLLPGLAAPFLSLAILISVALTHWPLRVSYALSRGAFDGLAQKVRGGEPLAMPQRAGLFTIRSAELSREGIVCLWTQVDPGGSTGFVLCKEDYVPFNLWSMVSLDDRWQFISED